ncbi:mob protein [Bacillus cereus]|nr:MULTISPECIES: MobV family relaxase [Bacillus]MDA2738883.1 plasmid recombination protein [Bacillus cereus group sp. Bc015]MEC3859493.1 MobV family relaxase [Bacillus sp. WOD8 KX774193]PRC95300.1 mob protein [Bacillus cereus]PRC99849.1 mob protein [Bacillus cereus]HDR6248348.1 plasmid recombination protein [Bacillus cereus]
MAHVQKYTRGNVQGLSIHWDRKTENHSNQDIDNERSHLNYDLCEKEGDTLSRMNDRLNEVHCLNRKDVKVCADWVVTLPESLKDTSEKEQREFFEKTYEFLANRYGGEKNVLSANVHNDETRPHMHFAFIPVVWDKKKLREKVSAKEVLTRKELKTFHQDLDKFLKKEIPYIYKEGILNDKTIGVDTVKDLKKYSGEIQKQKDAMDADYKGYEQKIEKQMQSVDKELKSKKDELLNLSRALPQTFNLKVKGKEKKTEVVKTGLFKSETVTNETGNWIVSDGEMRRMQKILRDANFVKEDYERLQRTDLVKENKELHDKVNSLVDGYVKAINENTDLHEKNRELRKEISSLKAHIKDLKENVKVLYFNTKKVLGKHFELFRELVKNELDMKGIDNQFDRNHKKEIKNQRGYDMER